MLKNFYPSLFVICICRAVQSGPHVIWVDNFSKILSRSVPTEQKGLYTSALWTGVAAFSGSTDGIDDSVRVDINGDVVPAMPDNIMEYRDAVKVGVIFTMRKGQFLFTNSLCTTYDVRTIPPKIDCRRFPDMRNVVEDGANTLNSVHPVDMMSQNIGSNRGLISVIRSFYERYNMHQERCDRYLTINADENIFWRILKVINVLILLNLYTTILFSLQFHYVVFVDDV